MQLVNGEAPPISYPHAYVCITFMSLYVKNNIIEVV